MKDAGIDFDGRLIGAVIYDYGEVLSYPPPASTIAAVAELLHVTPAKFREFYYAERHLYDRGQLSGEQYWQAVAGRAEMQLTTEQLEWLCRTDIEMWSKVNPAMLEWAVDLRRQGIKIAMLSNMHGEMATRVREEFTWLRDFDSLVLSAEVNYAKPEPQIYQLCLDGLKVAAGAALFIDDKPRNTAAAEQLGMAVVCADSPDTIRERLQEGGWTGPLPQQDRSSSV
jgi:putative hydrolase of the HAD superfamily